MKRLETGKLAEAIDALIMQNQALRQERTVLQISYNELLTERDELIRKNEVAKQKIEIMLERLKSLELIS